VTRPRVAHLTVAPEFVDRILIHDLRYLREHEEVTVICTDGPPLERARAEGFRVLTIPARRKMSPLADISSVRAIYRILRRGRFDILHTYTPKAGLLGQLAGFLARVPHRIHGCRGLLYSARTSFLHRSIFRGSDWLTGRLSHATLYLSSADMSFATGEGLCPPERARLIGSGIDLTIFSRSAVSNEEVEDWRRRLGIEPHQTLVLTVGRYVADKGYDELARAAAMLRDDFPDVRYVWAAPVFAGEDGVLPDSLLADRCVESIVQRIGFVENMPPLLAAADLLVHASHREGVPRAIMEAAAMEVPIVASDIPGSREIVAHGESALLFPPHDADALAAALRAALTDREATAGRARRALSRVRERFDHRSLASRIWEVHRALLHGDSVPSELTRGDASRAHVAG
jgi:glycosyltransferase involved in cell wall biosynthesis